MIVEYVKKDQTEAVLFVLGMSMQFRQIIPRVRLKGLKEEWIYQIEGSGRMSGKGLEHIGISTALTGDMDSRIYRISREGGKSKDESAKES